MIKINVPVLGESVSSATVAKIHKKEGEYVNVDELVFELETDKVTLEVSATSNGIIHSLKVAQGDNVLVGQELAIIDPQSAEANLVKNIEKPTEIIKDTEPKIETPILSPAAKVIAETNSLDVGKINGSGKDGRVTKFDVVSSLQKKHEPEKILQTNVEERVKVVKMSKLRQKIAERLKESQNTAAILTTFNEIDMFNVINIRNKYKEKFEKTHGVKLGFMSFFVKAVIQALKELPAVNAEISGDNIVYKNYYDIGVAVGTENGLVVPVVRDADKMSLADIESEISRLGKKARDGKLSIADLSGGTFTISNGGVYGSLMSTPIINPPQSGILGMHKTQDRVMVIDDKIDIRPMMYIALSYDHRIIDGKEAVTFLVRVKEMIENPERLMLMI